MDAWRTSCPRLSIWDDAIRDGLVRMEKGGGPMRQSLVMLDRSRPDRAENAQRRGALKLDSLAKNRRRGRPGGHLRFVNKLGVWCQCAAFWMRAPPAPAPRRFGPYCSSRLLAKQPGDILASASSAACRHGCGPLLALQLRLDSSSCEARRSRRAPIWLPASGSDRPAPESSPARGCSRSRACRPRASSRVALLPGVMLEPFLVSKGNDRALPVKNSDSELTRRRHDHCA